VGVSPIRPEGRFRSARRYVGPTAVLETTFETSTGAARLTDVMPIAEDAGTLHPMRELLRIVEGVEGEIVLEVRWEPRPDYGRAAPQIRSRGALGWACTWSDELFLLYTESPLELVSEERAVVGRIRVRPAGKFDSRSATPRAMSASSRRSVTPPTTASVPPTHGGPTGVGVAPTTGRIARQCCAAPSR
jgi:hypothetical protein